MYFTYAHSTMAFGAAFHRTDTLARAVRPLGLPSRSHFPHPQFRGQAPLVKLALVTVAFDPESGTFPDEPDPLRGGSRR